MKLGDPQDIQKLFSISFRSIVLVSNKKLLPSPETGNFISELGSTLFVYHNHSQEFTRLGLRKFYAPGSSEALFLMPNHLNSFWGLDANDKPLHQESPEFPLQAIITHWSPGPSPGWHWVEPALIRFLCKDYPPGKVPTNGFITRRLFQACSSYLNNLETPIFLYGFTMDDDYIKSPTTWNGHANLFERENLATSCTNKLCIQLPP